jgi:hypothetical protein
MGTEVQEMASRRGVEIEFHQTGIGNRLLEGKSYSKSKGVML